MSWREDLANAKIISVDIETLPWKCLGFSASPDKAYVFPFNRIDLIREVCASPVPKVFAGGKFDLFNLKYLWNVPVNGEIHDVFAQWFSLYPEIAGSKEDAKGKRSARATRKGLAFLSSILTHDAYWKGDYSNETEFYEYNGKDCCITLEVFHALQSQIKSKGVEGTYEHVRRLIWPVVDMMYRGLRVDDTLRLERMSSLKTRKEELSKELRDIVEPIMEKAYAADCMKEIEGKKMSGIKWDLFTEVAKTCPCCRHAKKKQLLCWGCEGLEKAPTKKLLKERGLTLGVCRVCNGDARASVMEWNPRSHTQTKVILYDVLKLPKRVKGGKLRSDEDALKMLLGGVQSR